MSGLDGLQLDADGFLDMGQFPDDGTDLDAAGLADLRTTLHDDPVEEPTADAWDAMFDHVVGAGDDGPFGLDDGLADLPFDLDGAGDDGTEAVAAAVDTDDDDTDVHHGDDPLDPDDPATDGLDVDDLDGTGLDDTGLDDTAADDIGVDDIGDDGVDLDVDDLDLDGGIDPHLPEVIDEAYDVDGVDVELPADISHDFEDTL